jgi:hypothetical protein
MRAIASRNCSVVIVVAMIPVVVELNNFRFQISDFKFQIITPLNLKFWNLEFEILLVNAVGVEPTLLGLKVRCFAN